MAYQAYAALDSILKASLTKKRADVDKSLKMIQMGMEKMKLDEAIAASRLNQSLAEIKINKASGEMEEWTANKENRQLLNDYNVTSARLQSEKLAVEIKDKQEDDFLEEMTKLLDQNKTYALQFSNSFSNSFGLAPIVDEDASQSEWITDKIDLLHDNYNIDKDDPFLQRFVSSAWVSRSGGDHIGNFSLINDLRLSISRSNAGIANDLDKQLLNNFNKLGVISKRPTEDNLAEELFINPNYESLISNVASVNDNINNISSEIDDYWSTQRKDITFNTKDKLNKIEFENISNTLNLLEEMKNNNAIQRSLDDTKRKKEELMQEKIKEARLDMISSNEWNEFDAKDIEKTYTNELNAIDTLNEDIDVSKEQIDEINSSIAVIQSENNSLKAARDAGYEIVNYDSKIDSNNTQLDSLYSQLGSTQAILDTDVEELDTREKVVNVMSSRQRAINSLRSKNLNLTEANIKKEEDKIKNEEKAFELVSKGIEPYGRVSGTGVKLLNKPLGISGATPGESPQPYFPKYEPDRIETPTISQEEISNFIRHPDLLEY